MTTSTSRSVREALAALPTASISDALDVFGLPGSLHGIGPLCDATHTVGPAFTVQYEPVNPEQPGTVGDFLDDVGPGSVVVIDNDGRTDCTVWGGIMTRAAAARGIAGTVIHGTCRDVPSILDVGYPMWSTARFMRTGKDRVQLRAVQVPLRVDGSPSTPGTGSAPTQTGPWSWPPTASTKSSKPHSASSAPKRPSPTPSSPDPP